MHRFSPPRFDPPRRELSSLRRDSGGFPGTPGRLERAVARVFHATLPLIAVLTGAWLFAPPELGAFVKRGEMLDTTQRDVRLFNNLADPQANDNLAPDAQYPGAQGAEMALWKAASEWGSRSHGSGLGDPTQPNLGDGGANFDYVWAGNATGVGGVDDNVISGLQCGGAGIIAFVEVPSTDGWRGRMCEEWVFNDGPGAIGFGQYDIQGVLTHLTGIALGLGNTGTGSGTMNGVITTGSLAERSIEADDIAGIQCIYGVAAPTKPEITDVSHGVGMLTLEGANFAATGNEVWFTSATATDPSVDPVVRVAGVPSSAGGTRIDVTVPVGAGPGDVLVKLPGANTGDLLSNAFPTPLDPCFPNRVLPAERPFFPRLVDSGGDPDFGPKIGDVTEVFNLDLDCGNMPSVGVYSIVLRLAHSTTPIMTGLGYLYCTGPKVLKCSGAHAQDVVVCAPGGVVLPNDVNFVDLVYCQQGFCSGSGGGQLSNAIVTTIGR